LSIRGHSSFISDDGARLLKKGSTERGKGKTWFDAERDVLLFMEGLENWTRVNLPTFLKDISEDERRVIRNAAIGWMALDDFWKAVVRRRGNGNENGEDVVKVILTRT
jgi:hypothetical protein